MLLQGVRPAQGQPGFELNEGMMSMIGGMTLLRALNLMGTMGEKPTKEKLLALNARLNKIRKPQG